MATNHTKRARDVEVPAKKRVKKSKQSKKGDSKVVAVPATEAPASPEQEKKKTKKKKKKAKETTDANGDTGSLQNDVPSKKSKAEAIDFNELRQEIIDTCLKMNSMGINQGTSGNVSATVENSKGQRFFLITPSGRAYESLSPVDLVLVNLEDDPGFYCRKALLPSSEWRLHYDLYRAFPDAKAVVHAHPISSTAIASLELEEIPAFHYMVAAAGGKSIAKAKYATFGTQELSDNMVIAMTNPTRKACLLANHGSVAYGPSLGKALWLANEVECLAKQYVQLLSTGKPPTLLSDEEMGVILAKFKTYGKNGQELQDILAEMASCGCCTTAVSAPKPLLKNPLE